MSGFATLGGYLYVGTWNETTGAQLWHSGDGTEWVPVFQDGLGDINNLAVELLYTFDGYLYAGIQNEVDGMELWQSTDGLSW